MTNYKTIDYLYHDNMPFHFLNTLMIWQVYFNCTLPEFISSESSQRTKEATSSSKPSNRLSDQNDYVDKGLEVSNAWYFYLESEVSRLHQSATTCSIIIINKYITNKLLSLSGFKNFDLCSFCNSFATCSYCGWLLNVHLLKQAS